MRDPIEDPNLKRSFDWSLIALWAFVIAGAVWLALVVPHYLPLLVCGR